jgi:beta-xylosidase
MFPYAEESEDGEICTRRLGSRDAEQEQVLWVRELMRETGTAGCRLYACEWNATLSNRSLLNDSCYRSAHIVRTANQIWDQVDMACIRMGSDIVGSYYDSARTASGNGGLLTADGIRKPAFFAFQFLHALGDYLVDRGEGYLITRSAHGRFFILLYYYKWFSSGFFLRREYEIKPEELGEMFEDNQPVDLELVLRQLPDNTAYYINRQSIGCGEGSLLHEWSNFQYGESPECRSYLQQICFPRMSMVKQTTRNNRLVIREHLQAHEVVLLYIYADI